MLADLITSLVLFLFPTTATNLPLVSRLPALQYHPTAVTESTIFAPDHMQVATLSARRKRIMIATGDVMPGRSVNAKSVANGNFTWPYEQTASLLKSGDVTFINLESPLISDCPISNEGFKFCANDAAVAGLTFAGVDVASLANNHATNYGLDGIMHTQTVLGQQNILTTGINGPVYSDVRGLRFAFLGYNDVGKYSGISLADDAKASEEIKQAKKQAQIVVVTFHWGAEYQSQPTSRQIYLAHLAIDSGADVVVGNHPHWIQPVEIYKTKPIMYSLGNFVFDQDWSLKTRQGLVARYTFYDSDLVDIELLPVMIEPLGQPHFLQGEEKEKILSEVKSLSEQLQSKQLQ